MHNITTYQKQCGSWRRHLDTKWLSLLLLLPRLIVVVGSKRRLDARREHNERVKYGILGLAMSTTGSESVVVLVCNNSDIHCRTNDTNDRHPRRAAATTMHDDLLTLSWLHEAFHLVVLLLLFFVVIYIRLLIRYWCYWHCYCIFCCFCFTLCKAAVRIRQKKNNKQIIHVHKLKKN